MKEIRRHRHPLLKLVVFLGLIFIFVASLRAALSKTYPTSPVTFVRLEVYTEVFKTIHESTSPFVLTVGSPFYLMLISSETLDGTTVYFNSNSTTTKTAIRYELSDEQVKYNLINRILDNDVEQYLVAPDSNTYSKDWAGWCWDTTSLGTTYYTLCKSTPTFIP